MTSSALSVTTGNTQYLEQWEGDLRGPLDIYLPSVLTDIVTQYLILPQTIQKMKKLFPSIEHLNTFLKKFSFDFGDIVQFLAELPHISRKVTDLPYSLLDSQIQERGLAVLTGENTPEIPQGSCVLTMKSRAVDQFGYFEISGSSPDVRGWEFFPCLGLTGGNYVNVRKKLIKKETVLSGISESTIWDILTDLVNHMVHTSWYFSNLMDLRYRIPTGM